MLALRSRIVLLAIALCAFGSLAAVPAAALSPDDAPWQLLSTSRRAPAEASPLVDGALLPRSVARAKFSLRDEPATGKPTTIAHAPEPAARALPRLASTRRAPRDGRDTHLRIGVLLI